MIVWPFDHDRCVVRRIMGTQYEMPGRVGVFGIKEIIDPRDTRPLLCEWIGTAYDLLPSTLGPTGRTGRC